MSYESLRNIGLWHLNGRPEGDERTLIVVGVARSGTSMVAGALQALGVHMGEQKNDVVFEDRELAAALEQRGRRAQLDELLRRRNERHRVWGWKRPGAYSYVEPYLPRLRNPALIVTFRDVLAIAMRNAISIRSDVLKGIEAAQRETRRLLDFVARVRVPTMLVSYEKAILNRSAFVTALAEFAGIEPTAERREAATAGIRKDPPEYLRRAREFSLLGGIATVRNGHLLGWAKDPRSDQPVTLQIKVNGEPWREVRADQFRKGLKQKSIGSGHYGFRVDLSELADRARPVEISVIEASSGEEIRNSPWTLEDHGQ